jgi:hypothetical protein
MLTGWWTAAGRCKISLNPALQLQGFIPPFHYSTIPLFHHSTISYSTIPIPLNLDTLYGQVNYGELNGKLLEKAARVMPEKDGAPDT